MKAAERIIHEGQFTIRLKVTDQVCLIIHHGPEPPFTFGDRAFRSPAFGGGGGEEQIGLGQDPHITPDEHQAFLFSVGDKGAFAAKKRIKCQRRDQECSGSCSPWPKPQRAPHQERERQVSQRIVLDAVNEPGIEGNQSPAHQPSSADDCLD